MASSSSSSLSLSLPSPSLLQTREYDVFTSFHGPDVRKTFLSHIRREFKRKGIKMFNDDEMKRGEFIGSVLKEPIRESKIVLVLLSKDYASSSWCLDELVEIMKYKTELGQTVITIFYGVEPTNVKKQTGDFGKAFKNTCKGKTEEKVQTWTKALEDLATIAGYHSSNWANDATIIENIVVDISNKLNHLTPSHDFGRFIGMEAHMRKMDQLLGLDWDEVRMIGIWGPPGIGKTAIARFLFGQLSAKFQNSAFMENIKGNYQRPCLDAYDAKLKLQEETFSQIINLKDIMINLKDIVIPHLRVAQQRLKHDRVLLVLDDVDLFPQQLQALGECVRWFGPGSRIITTAENREVLKAHGIEHIYKVDFPSNDEALEMFCKYAFNKMTPEDGFDALAREITYIAGQLPLVLNVIGSHFRDLTKKEWLTEVSRLRTYLHGDVENILKFSYDALCPEDKELFLHIACCFNMNDIEDVDEFLAEKFKYLSQKLYGLERKSLISIEDASDNHRKFIKMHKLLVQIGKEIVRKQSVSERQFLVSVEDSCEEHTTKAFEEMYNLEFVRVDNYPLKVITSAGPLTIVSPKLQLLEWQSFPMTCLHFTNNLECLVELKMPCSKLEKLWDEPKLLQNLRLMDMSNSENLKELPNLSMATSLKKLNLSGCSSLVKLPPSIGNAISLKELNLGGSLSLVDLPYSIGQLTNLSRLDLRGCSSLVKLPPSIGNATNLKELYLNSCSSLVELPSSIRNATRLNVLCLRDCSSLVLLPQLPDSLLELEAERCESLEKLECSFCNPKIRLKFVNCFKLNQEARDLIMERSTLRSAVLPGGGVPACFTYRGYGSSVTVKLNQKPLPKSTKFKACISFVDKDENEAGYCGSVRVSCTARISNGLYINPILKEHLYIFEFKVEEEVTSTELAFEFELNREDIPAIKECGIIHSIRMMKIMAA